MKRSRSIRIGLFVTAAILIGIAVGAALRYLSSRSDSPREPATEETVEQFYVGVAALDAEDNDRALRIFEQLSQAAESDPAVWANLALVHMRIGDVPRARQLLAHAAMLAPHSNQVALLGARAEELGGGGIDRAIQLLEQVPEPSVVTLFALERLMARSRRDGAPDRQWELITRILELQPTNLAARFEQARLAAQLEEPERLTATLSELALDSDAWSTAAKEEFALARDAAQRGSFRDVAARVSRLENLFKSDPQYSMGLVALGASSDALGQPIREFLLLPVPPATVAPADLTLEFHAQQPSSEAAMRSDLLVALPMAGQRGSTLVSFLAGGVHVAEAPALRFPGSTSANTTCRESVQVADLNGDFREDVVLAGEGGCVVYLQDDSGQWAPWTPSEEEAVLFNQPSDGVWVLDIEADGDLDLVVSRIEGPSQVVRNNGDMKFAPSTSLAEVPPLRQLIWLDFDNDGDADVAVLDRRGRVLFYQNERSGRFLPAVRPFADNTIVALTAGDVTRDGAFSLVALNADGAIQAASKDPRGEAWVTRELSRWQDAPDLHAAFESRRASLHLADLDNNGAIDLVASAETKSVVWLGAREPTFQRLADSPAMFVAAVSDLDGDGRIDLVGMTPDGARIVQNLSGAGYGWQLLETRAVQTAGDNRFNSFGLGGRIELRAGQLVQAAPILSSRTHFGLGRYARAGVARIVWPNGTVLIEFDLEPNSVVSAQQRLKGSCPFVFAHDGAGLRFVKDFIWRSPLGLRINSQDTAGITQTEDWIKVPGDLLAAHDGGYELRITAELWETHFFDSISLMAVDHPAEVDVWVDERFVAASQPTLGVVATTPPRPLEHVYDERGELVTEWTRRIDGRYVDSFQLGRFQGVAEEHWIEFRLDPDLPEGRPTHLIGHGWVYPTDSSLNVAMAQGDFARPFGLVLEVADDDGTWRAASPDLGFPAGKNKTVLLPLPEELISQGKRRFRLRTNLEVYWDYLGWAIAKPDVPLQTVPRKPAIADLRYRGFSELSSPNRRRPDVPRYDRLSGTGQRWRDLEGFYTRYGDVRELLAEVDDRYIIMNAGDEILLRFEEIEPPAAGWKRDFVLVGDGWVKDGDYNTAFSKSVRPLPTHDSADYSAVPGALRDDPVYQRHSEDWQRYHTRYVTPREFERGLWPPLDGVPSTVEQGTKRAASIAASEPKAP